MTNQPKVRKHRPGSGPGGKRTLGHKPKHYAVLLSHRTVRTPEEFAVDGDGEARATIRFEPLARLENRNATLGLIRLESGFNQLSVGMHTVDRTAKRKPTPENMLVLSQVPHMRVSASSAQRKGMLRDVETALNELCSEKQASSAQWWLALECAVHGYVTDGWLDHCREVLGETPKLLKKYFSNYGSSHVWHGFIERKTEELGTLLEKKRRTNPILDRITLSIAAECCTYCNRDALCAVMKSAAKQFRGKFIASPVGEYMRLPEPKDVPQNFKATADEILSRFNEGNGGFRSKLAADYPAQMNVVQGLFASHYLYESPDGYVFTRDQLESWVAKLSKDSSDLRSTSVKKIKDSLGLSRREAEALREFLQQYATANPKPKAARGGA